MWRDRPVASTSCHSVVMDAALRQPAPLLTVEAFVGHRVWRVVPRAGEPVLASATSGDPWLRSQVEAACFAEVLLQPLERRALPDRHPDEVSPALDCTCGLYASKTPLAPSHRRVWAAGRVRLWGRVIEGTKGFRGQRASIIEDLDIYLGMGPGRPRCTLPPCRDAATGVWVGSTSFLSRCDRHGRGGTIGFGEFEAWVDASFRRRYRVGATLASQ